MKKIDITKSVYEIVKNDPEIINIMKDLGFEDITEPGMLNTAGRFMTIPKGAKMKKIPMNKVMEVFENYGYKINE